MRIPSAPVAGDFRAHPTHALATSGNRPHSPRAWATAVAAGMIGIDPAMPPARKAVAHNVRQQVEQILTGLFSTLKTTTTPLDIETLSILGVLRSVRVFNATHWRFEASSADIQREFQRYIAANLTDATNLIQRLGD